MRTVGMGAIPKDAALKQEIADLKAEKVPKKTKAEDQDPVEE